MPIEEKYPSRDTVWKPRISAASTIQLAASVVTEAATFLLVTSLAGWRNHDLELFEFSTVQLLQTLSFGRSELSQRRKLNLPNTKIAKKFLVRNGLKDFFIILESLVEKDI